MEEFKGTQGKWEVVAGDDNAPDVISDIGVEVAFTPTYNGDKTEQWHNAKLIAASPELLSATQRLLEIYDDQSGKVWTTSSKRRALDDARAAVNKALGGNKMTWILFIIVASYQGPAVTKAEFSNRNACENAAKNISAIFNKKYSSFDAICVQKGTGKTK